MEVAVEEAEVREEEDVGAEAEEEEDVVDTITITTMAATTVEGIHPSSSKVLPVILVVPMPLIRKESSQQTVRSKFPGKKEEVRIDYRGATCLVHSACAASILKARVFLFLNLNRGLSLF